MCRNIDAIGSNYVSGAFLAEFSVDLLLVEEVVPMCDYSLHNVVSRPAKIGDELVTTEFVNTFTRGFSAIGEPNMAVCLLAGTELAFKEEASCDHLLTTLLPWLRFGKLGEKVARFRQINVDQPNVHHDALEFANGKIAFVTTLRPGQRVTVVQLPVRVRAGPQIEKQRVASLGVDGVRVEICQR
jgi:hypothetical protein